MSQVVTNGMTNAIYPPNLGGVATKIIKVLRYIYKDSLRNVRWETMCP